MLQYNATLCLTHRFMPDPFSRRSTQATSLLSNSCSPKSGLSLLQKTSRRRHRHRHRHRTRPSSSNSSNNVLVALIAESLTRPCGDATPRAKPSAMLVAFTSNHAKSHVPHPWLARQRLLQQLQPPFANPQTEVEKQICPT